MPFMALAEPLKEPFASSIVERLQSAARLGDIGDATEQRG